MGDKGRTFYVKSNDKRVLEAIENIGKKAKNPNKLMRQLTQIMFEYTGENFETEGQNMGEKWEKWSDPYTLWRSKNKRSGGQILELNGELIKGIGKKYTNDTAMIYADKIYSAIHNFGYDGKITRKTKKGSTSYDLKMPERPFMKWTEDLIQEILDEVESELYINENYDDSFL